MGRPGRRIRRTKEKEKEKEGERTRQKLWQERRLPLARPGRLVRRPGEELVGDAYFAEAPTDKVNVAGALGESHMETSEHDEGKSRKTLRKSGWERRGRREKVYHGRPGKGRPAEPRPPGGGVVLPAGQGEAQACRLVAEKADADLEGRGKGAEQEGEGDGRQHEGGAVTGVNLRKQEIIDLGHFPIKS